MIKIKKLLEKRIECDLNITPPELSDAEPIIDPDRNLDGVREETIQFNREAYALN